MDVVAVQAAAAKARAVTRLSQAAGRAISPPLVPPAAMTSPPTLTLSKSQGVSAVSSIASGGSGYAVNEIVTLTGGTFEVAAKLRVVSVSAGAITAASVDRAGVYTANPSSPVAQGSTSGSGTGATFNLTFAASVAASMSSAVTYTATNAAFRFIGNGPGNISSSGFYGNSTGNGTASVFEWCSDASSIDVRLIGLSTQAMLFVDGIRVNDTGATTDSSGAPYLWSVDFGGSQTPRTFRLWAFNQAFGGVRVGPTATVWAPTHARRPLAWGLGDSYMFGTGATHSSMAGFNQMCRLLGLEPLADGIGGTGWTSTAGNVPAARVAAKLGALTYVPDYVFLDMGYNDAGGNMATLATNFDAAVTAVRAAAPKARIIAFGPATPLGTTANLTAVKTALSTACIAAGISFIDVDNWVSSTNASLYTGGDNTHPTQAGFDYLAARRAQAVSALISA